MAIRIAEAASYRLDEIYRYSRDQWGEAQAARYLEGLFAAFAGIETRKTLSMPVPGEFSVDGYFFRYQQHFVYWRALSGGDIGIVTILHKRMHQIDRFQQDFGL